MESFDLIVIGAGPGGYEAAIRAAQLGMKVAVVENRDVGGTCLNRGCIPTKTLLHATELYKKAVKHGEQVGLSFEGASYSIPALYARKDTVVSQLRGGIEQLFKANKITLYRGTGTITAPHNVMVLSAEGTEKLEAKNILLATGSIPSRPPIEGLNLPNVITSDELLDMNDRMYDSIVVIGGGVIGVEFASVYYNLGKQVTIIEAMDRLLPPTDKDVSKNLEMIFKKRGVNIHTSSMVKRISEVDGHLAVTFENKGEEKTVEADGVLVAIGRRAYTEGLFVEGFGVEMNRGMIKVNENYETSVPGVFAIGDVTGGVMLAHVASAEGITAVESMLNKPHSIDLKTIPSCIYTDPEIAEVGLSEAAAIEKGYEVEVGKVLMNSNGKTVIELSDRGFIKVVFDKKTEVLLGASLMCERATDLINELATAVSNKLTKQQLLRVIRPHPTFGEAVTEAIETIDGEAIHVAPLKKK